MSGAISRAGVGEAALSDAGTGCCKRVALLGDGLLQAEVFRAVEQFEQLAFLDAIDLVARGLGLGFGFGCRLPGSLVDLGAVLESVGKCRRRGEYAERHCQYR